jgi:hypothetical protein
LYLHALAAALPLIGAGFARADKPTAAPGLMAAIDRVAAQQADPEPARLRLLARMQFAPTCYPGDLTPAQLDELVAQTLLLPPGSQPTFGPRFIADTKSWTGAGQIGDGGTSRPATLTYSFPDDGTPWGSTCSGFAVGPNDLGARMSGTIVYVDPNDSNPNTQNHTIIGPFAPNLDRGREFIRSALAGWRSVGGLTYLEVADDNAPEDIDPTHPSTRGDIRIGGWGFIGTPIGPGGPLAYNGLPNSPIASCSGGDMTLNTNYFTSAYFNSSLSGLYLYFRNTVAHEHGHGLGYFHTVPCNQTKLMEPQIHTVVSTLSPDEIRAAIRHYGDRNASGAGNHSSANAKNYGNLTTPAVRSVIERDLGVNGNTVVINTQPITILTEEDWYKFTLDTTQSVTISAAPTGYAPIGSCCAAGACAVTTQINCTATWTVRGTCSGTTCVAPTLPTTCSGGTNDPWWCQGSQTGSCAGTNNSVNAQSAGNLALELRSSNATTILNSANSNDLGVTESVVASLGPGTYYVKVYDAAGGNGWTSNNQIVQTYDLTIRVGASKAPPFVIAGLQRKRARADAVCQFIGNHNSYATEPGATLPPANFSWDLDGNGSFETNGQNQPQFTYRSNGTFNVTLRVTDSLGSAATDTVQVVVFGATTTITSVNPSSSSQGVTIPVTIVGSNFKGVTSALQVAVSGSGVSVTGTPVPNALGTNITGLSFVVSPGAAPGPRSVTVSNSDGQGGTGTGVDVFTINGAATNGACCAPDGTCTLTDQPSCASIFQGLGTSCTPNVCTQPNVSCCAASGVCTFVTAASCTGTAGAFGTSCSPNICPQPSVACCAADGGCTFVTAAACTGTPGAFGSTCNPNACPQPTGACCLGVTCQVRGPAACTGPFSHFVGMQTVCNALGNNATPCCRGDFNQSGALEVQDIFDYLNAWFATFPAADFNGGGLDVQDIFDFLNAWFGGC